MGINGTVNKKITNLFLMHSTNDELSEFLNGIYSGDGYVSKNSIELTTKSFELASGIETILLRLKILFNSCVKIKVATNSNFSGIYKNIVISDQESIRKFSNCVTLAHSAKNEKLRFLIHEKVNPNLDLIESNFLIRNVVNDLRINVKKVKKYFPRLDSYV